MPRRSAREDMSLGVRLHTSLFAGVFNRFVKQRIGEPSSTYPDRSVLSYKDNSLRANGRGTGKMKHTHRRKRLAGHAQLMSAAHVYDPRGSSKSASRHSSVGRTLLQLAVGEVLVLGDFCWSDSLLEQFTWAMRSVSQATATSEFS